mmetsp:Transcript_29698/g.33339  ORF Transcript_29698/g.33339 Transcript_29698/m.33339 type:complete len:381 (+) Transcript_29698:289-1431(+)
MTHRISQKSLPIPDVNVRAMINVPNGTAAQRRKRQKLRTKILKKLSNLRTKDVLEMNSEDLTRLKQIRALMQEFGSRDVFLSSFRDATTIGHELSIAKKILDIIDSYPNKYVPFQIAKATKLFNTSMIIYDKKLSGKIYRQALVPFESIGTIAYDDEQLMTLHDRATTKYNATQEMVLKFKELENEFKLGDKKLENEGKKTDAELTGKLSEDKLSMHKTTTDADVTTHKQDCELKLSRHQTTTDVDAKIAVATQKKENNSEEEIIEIESFDSPDTCCGGNENLNPANGHDDRHSSSGGKTLLDKFDLVDTRSDEDSSDVDRQSRNRSAGHLALLGNGQSSSSPAQRAPIRMNLETKSCVTPSRSTSFPVAFSPMTSSTSS